MISCVARTYLYGAFDCMLLSCHVRISEWIHTLYLPECQGTSCSKQVRYLKFKWQQRDSNLQPLSSSGNTQPISHTGQMIELCCENLSVRILLSCHVHVSEWIYTFYSCLNVKELLTWNRRNIWSLVERNEIRTHNLFVSKQTLNYLAKLPK